MKQYGVPYKGSKNKLAERICDLFPRKRNLVDLLAGGCAVADCAMHRRQFERYIINDVDPMPTELYLRAVRGEYERETRWISREDFERMKDSDPYVRYCWSYGNNGRDYMYSREVEPWKRALHYARVLGDGSLLSAIGIQNASGEWIRNHHAECKEKYIAWWLRTYSGEIRTAEELRTLYAAQRDTLAEELRRYLVDGLTRSGKTRADVDRFLGTNGMAGHYFCRSQWEFPTREVYGKLRDYIGYDKGYDEIHGLAELFDCLQRLQRLQSLQSLQRLQRLQSLQSLQSLQRWSLDYRAVTIPPDSVVYCDIPYINTDDYGSAFDHAAFYDWAEQQSQPIYISSYTMPPDRFAVVAEFQHQCNLHGGGKRITERVFVPLRQFSPRMIQPDLFI